MIPSPVIVNCGYVWFSQNAELLISVVAHTNTYQNLPSQVSESRDSLFDHCLPSSPRHSPSSGGAPLSPRRKNTYVTTDGTDANDAIDPLLADEAVQEQSEVRVAVGNDGLQHTGSNFAVGYGDVKAAPEDEFDDLAEQNGAMTNESRCFVIYQNFIDLSFG